MGKGALKFTDNRSSINRVSVEPKSPFRGFLEISSKLVYSEDTINQDKIGINIPDQ